MALRLVRQSSDAPNVTNRDDACMARYAYNGRNGIVQNFGKECSAEIGSGTLTLNSGRIVLQGWEVDIEREILSVYASSATYAYIYLQVNLLLEEASLNIIYSQDTVFPLDLGEDLTHNPSGTARLVLYSCVVAGNSILSLNKVARTIHYLSDFRGHDTGFEYRPDFSLEKHLDEYMEEAHLFVSSKYIADGAPYDAAHGYLDVSRHSGDGFNGSNFKPTVKHVFTSWDTGDTYIRVFNGSIWTDWHRINDGGNAMYATYASSDTSKGTIEQRLTNLGFKEGEFSWEGGVPQSSTLYKQANYVIGTCENSYYESPLRGEEQKSYTLSDGATLTGHLIGKIPLDMLPSVNTYSKNLFKNSAILQGFYDSTLNQLRISSLTVDSINGNCYIKTLNYFNVQYITLKLGYEIKGGI